MKRRVLTVGLAVLLAVVGTAGVLAYVHKADTRALQGMRAVSVLVAQNQIPAGTSANAALQSGLLRSERFPASSVAPNAVHSITPALGTLVMSSQIASGEVLLRPMLVTAAQATGGVALPAGMVAVSVNLCVPEAVAENIGPGSEVEVLNTLSPRPPALTAGPNCQGPHMEQFNAHTRVLIQKVEVLSVGLAGGAGHSSSNTSVFSRTSTDGPSTSGPVGVNSVTVTFAVTQTDLLKLVQAAVAGLPYLALIQH